MTHAPIRSFCATTAICAVLALGSTPAWAQDASAPVSEPPAITLPTPVQAPVQQPTIVLPAESPAAPASTAAARPVPETAPMAATSDEAAPVRSTPRPAAAKSAAAPVERTATTKAAAPVMPSVTRVAAPAPSVADATPPVAAPPLAQPAVTAPPPAAEVSPATAESYTGLRSAALIAGLLAALGAGAAGVLALRARRREDEYDYDETHEPTYDPMPAAVIAANEPELPLPAYVTAYAIAENRREETAPQAVAPTPHPVTLDPAPTAAQRIGSEELVPDTRDERDALLDQMVAAEPDAENPFTSRKGRMRRARLILQAREYEQKEAEAQPFDWRTYQPSTSNPAPANSPAGHGLKVRVPSPSQEGMG